MDAADTGSPSLDANPLQRLWRRQFRLAAWTTLLVLGLLALSIQSWIQWEARQSARAERLIAKEERRAADAAWAARLEALGRKMSAFQKKAATATASSASDQERLRQAALSHFGEVAALADELDQAGPQRREAWQGALHRHVVTLQEALSQAETAAAEQRRARAIAAASHKDYAGQAITPHTTSRNGRVWYRAHNGRGVIVVAAPDVPPRPDSPARQEAKRRVYSLPEVW